MRAIGNYADDGPELPTAALIRKARGQPQSRNRGVIDETDLVLTDPPYNVAYQGYTDEKLTIQNDAMSAEDFRQFLVDTFAS